MINCYKYRVILIGDLGVGKSALSYRYVDSKFNSRTLPTIFIECQKKDIEIDGKFVSLSIWDTVTSYNK